MGRFIKGCDRREQLFLPPCVDDYVDEDSTVRIVDELDLATLGFAGAAATGRPGYHPAMLLTLYVYGYLNQVQSSRCLEREAGRNVELMWLTGKLAPDIKTIATFGANMGCDPGGLSPVREVVSAARPHRGRHGRGGREPLSRGEYARP